VGEKMCNSKIIIVCFIFVSTFSLCAEAKLYKWVDEHGSVHYGEVIPPEYASKDKEPPHKTDMIGQRIEIMSPEMIRAKEEDTAKKIANKKEMENNKQRDKALLNTYSSESEIDQARDRSLELISARIESYNILLRSSQNTLDDLKKEVVDRSKQGKKIPQSLNDDITLTEEKLSRYQSDRSKNEEVLKSAKARFENDKILYRKIVVVNPDKNDSSAYPDSVDTNNYSESGEYHDSYRRSKKARSKSQY
jgi:hypothetical protein